MSYYTLENKRLPPPFVSNCINYSKFRNGREGKTDCHQRCVKDKTMDTYNKIPFSSIESEARNQTALSYLDVQNLSVVQELFQFYSVCDKECERFDCDEFIYFTRPNYKPRSYNLAFDAYLPFEPSIKVVSKEQLTFAQFASIILSTFGTWFGISVIALNPSRLKTLKKNGCKNVRTDSFPSTVSDGNHQQPPVGTIGLVSRIGHHHQTLIKMRKDGDLLMRKQVVSLTQRINKIERFVNNNRR